jgi:hypothetical protein
MIFMSERWKDVKGYNGSYQISNYGRVKSIARLVKNKTGLRVVPEIILSHGINEYGYAYVILFKLNTGRPFRVNRLVAKAFIRNPLNKKEVNHLDGDRLNNRKTNLEWSTRSENLKHKGRLKRMGIQLKLQL